MTTINIKIRTKIRFLIQFVLLSIFWTSLYSFESIEVLDSSINIKRSGYIIADHNSTAQQVYSIFLKKKLHKLPEEAKSFGYSKQVFWYVFEIQNNVKDKRVWMDLKHTVDEFAWLYTFQDGTLVKTQKSGYGLPLELRSIETVPSRFQLEESQGSVVYLLKIKSDSTQYAAFAFGTSDDLDPYWYKLYGFTILSIGVFFGLALYNGFLFISTKDKAYLFYLLYTVGLATYDLVDTGLASIFYDFIGNDISTNLVYIKAFELIMLILFTISFLQLSIHLRQYKRFLWFWIGILPIVSYLYLQDIGRDFSLILINITSLILLLIGFSSYKNGYKPALYYLIATGGGLIVMSIFFLMPLGLIPLSFVGVNLINVAIVWDMIMFSLALAYRIKVLQQEHQEQEHLLIMKSRQYSIGELSGNIAHQWRTPLSQLGSICANMEAKLHYASLSKDDMIKALSSSKKILAHLSETIETFQSFFQNIKSSDSFSVNDEILKTIDFIKESLKDNQIEIKYETATDLIMYGNRNELTQVLLNIILNAKDMLIQNNTLTPCIKISCIKTDRAFIIEVYDNAGGINIKPIDAIFEPFITDKENGTGIGLFIAKMIVEKKLNGKLSACNVRDGALFKIVFKN